jgi:hypothetical protein
LGISEGASYLWLLNFKNSMYNNFSMRFVDILHLFSFYFFRTHLYRNLPYKHFSPFLIHSKCKGISKKIQRVPIPKPSPHALHHPPASNHQTLEYSRLPICAKQGWTCEEVDGDLLGTGTSCSVCFAEKISLLREAFYLSQTVLWGGWAHIFCTFCILT